MHPRTEATLKELRECDWFSHVGVEDAGGDAVVLSSWKEAVKSCGSAQWEDLCLEAVNQYCDKLVANDPKRFEQWNDIVIQVKPSVQEIVAEKTEKVVQDNGLPKVFVDTVRWDILHLCMESEYADVYPPGFFASQAYWYTKGHFPCGWKGRFPDGKLVIY